MKTSQHKKFSEFINESEIVSFQKTVNKRLASFSTEFSDLDVNVDAEDGVNIIKISISSDHISSFGNGSPQPNGIENREGIQFTQAEWEGQTDDEIQKRITSMFTNLKNW